jgi:hypothetical protein
VSATPLEYRLMRKFTGTIQCDVPVCIVMEEGRIARVIVLDEELDLTTAKLVEPRGNAHFEDSETLRLAKKQAGDCGDWPAWEFGW